MSYFADTNILLDVLLARQPQYDSSARLWWLAETRRASILVSAISFNNVFYILRRFAGRESAQKAVEAMEALFRVIATTQDILRLAIHSRMPDFEDAIQYYSALSVDAECLITRNVRDFPAEGSLPVWSPEYFVTQHPWESNPNS